ncbi:MAG TPA: response regulator [candidate division Zixibacteria bacterium]|nr:response regulator [candidate division Zixibacteria bacterium]
MTKILIIDDSEVIRDLLQEYLIDIGYDVDLAVNGLDGIEKALQGNYRIIFCDIHMPKRNGYQVFTEVSARKPASSFVMTDSLPDHLAEMAEKAGACRTLTKPFDLNEVKATIESILSGTKVK